MSICAKGLAECLTQQASHIARLHLLVSHSGLTSHNAILLSGKGVLHIILLRGSTHASANSSSFDSTHVEHILDHSRSVVRASDTTTVGSTCYIASIIAVGHLGRCNTSITSDTANIGAGTNNFSLVHTTIDSRVGSHIGSDTSHILLGRNLTFDSHVADSSILQVCEKTLIGSCGIVDIETLYSMSLTIKHALIGLCCCGAANRCPCIVAQIDVGSQHSLCCVLSPIHLISKPSQLCSCSNLIDILYDGRLSLSLSIPCCSIGSSQCHSEGLIALGIITNGIGVAIAAITSLRSRQRIVAIGTRVGAIIIEFHSHAIACQSIVHALLLAQQTNDELLGLRNGETHFGDSTKVGLVCNSGEVGRATHQATSVTMVTNRITIAIHLNHALVHQHLSAGIVGNGHRNSLCRRHRTESVLTTTQNQRRAVRNSIIGHIGRHIIDTSHLIGRMTQARVLNLHLITRNEGVAALTGDISNVAMALLGCQHLIDSVSCGIGQSDNLATFLQEYGIRTIFILRNTRCSKARIGSHLLTNRGIGHLYSIYTRRSKGISEAIFCIQIIEHIMLGINKLACQLLGIFVV